MSVQRMCACVVLLAVVATLVGGCAAGQATTEPGATQTPWIVIVTATPAAHEATQAPRVVVVTATPGAPERPAPTQTPWIIVATPTSAGYAPPTATRAAQASLTPSATGTGPAPTATRTSAPPTGTPAALKYEAPTLLEPPDGAPYSWGSTVTLQWTPVGTLLQDEYYHVHVEAYLEATDGFWYGDYAYTKEPTILLDQSFLAPFHPSPEKGRALMYWWVRVVRKVGEDANGKPMGVDIGRLSAKRYIAIEPKPGP